MSNNDRSEDESPEAHAHAGGSMRPLIPVFIALAVILVVFAGTIFKESVLDSDRLQGEWVALSPTAMAGTTVRFQDGYMITHDGGRWPYTLSGDTISFRVDLEGASMGQDHQIVWGEDRTVSFSDFELVPPDSEKGRYATANREEPESEVTGVAQVGGVRFDFGVVSTSGLELPSDVEAGDELVFAIKWDAAGNPQLRYLRNDTKSDSGDVETVNTDNLSGEITRSTAEGGNSSGPAGSDIRLLSTLRGDELSPGMLVRVEMPENVMHKWKDGSPVTDFFDGLTQLNGGKAWLATDEIEYGWFETGDSVVLEIQSVTPEKSTVWSWRIQARICRPAD